MAHSFPSFRLRCKELSSCVEVDLLNYLSKEAAHRRLSCSPVGDFHALLRLEAVLEHIFLVLAESEIIGPFLNLHLGAFVVFGHDESGKQSHTGTSNH